MLQLTKKQRSKVVLRTLQNCDISSHGFTFAPKTYNSVHNTNRYCVVSVITMQTCDKNYSEKLEDFIL